MGNCGSAATSPQKSNDNRAKKRDRRLSNLDPVAIPASPEQQHVTRRKSLEGGSNKPSPGQDSGRNENRSPGKTASTDLHQPKHTADSNDTKKPAAHTSSVPGTSRRPSTAQHGAPTKPKSDGPNVPKSSSEPVDVLAMMKDKTRAADGTQATGPTRAAMERAEKAAARTVAELGRRGSGQATIMLGNLNVSDTNDGVLAPNSPEHDVNSFDPRQLARRGSTDRKAALQQAETPAPVTTPKKSPRQTTSPMSPSSPSNDLVGFDFLAVEKDVRRNSIPNDNEYTPEKRSPPTKGPSKRDMVSPSSATSPTPTLDVNLQSVHELAQAHRDRISKQEAAKQPILAPLAMSVGFDAEQEARDRQQMEHEEKIERERRRAEAHAHQAEYVRKLHYHHGVPLENLEAPWRRRASTTSMENIKPANTAQDGLDDVQREAYLRAESFVPKSHKQAQKERYEQLLKEQNTAGPSPASPPEPIRRATMPELFGSKPAYNPLANFLRNSVPEATRPQSNPHPTTSAITTGTAPQLQRARTTIDDKIARAIMQAQANIKSKHSQTSAEAAAIDEADDDDEPGPTAREMKYRLMASVLGIRRSPDDAHKHSSRRHSLSGKSGGSSGGSGEKSERKLKSEARRESSARASSATSPKTSTATTTGLPRDTSDIPKFDFENM